MPPTSARSAASERARAPAFFEACHGLFERAASRGRLVRELTLGGRAVRLEMAGRPLLDALWPPLAHLAAATEQPALRVLAWEGVDGLPPLPWDFEAIGPGGMVTALTTDQSRVAVRLDSRLVVALDLGSGTGFFWAPEASRLPWWERAAPLRSLLGWWARRADQQLVHAAAVSWRGAAVVLVGRAGSGKSTTALACLQDPELGLIGDDYILLHQPGPLTAEPVYGCAKLEAGHLEARLPWLLPMVVNPRGGPDEKRVVAWAQHHPDRVTRAARVVALAVSAVSEGEESAVRPTSRARILAEMAPTTLFQLPGSSGRTLSQLAGWVRQLPAYELSVGRDLRTLPGAVRALLRQLGGTHR